MCVSNFHGAPLTMSEGWEDWPLLGQGWKRRTAVRKSGQSCGQTDTYYQSPTGQRFRSKPELAKFLGESVDLSCFNFKHGTLIPPEKRKKNKKKKKKTSPSSPATPTSPGKTEKLLFPLQSSDEHQQNGKKDKSVVACCTKCKVWYSGVEFGRSKQTVWYCADCRASRRAFNKEQKRLKSIGCGKCAACSLTENCGYCSICLLRSHNPEFGSSWKCMKRRCQKAIQKPGDCGECQGCTATEDCETCFVCLKRQQNPELEINRKCVKRRCQKKVTKSESKLSVMKDFGAKKLKTLVTAVYLPGGILPVRTEKKITYLYVHLPGSVRPYFYDGQTIRKWRLMSERDGSSLPVKHKKVGRRKNRKCGTCEACQRKLDCGDCDFCQDKPKFGGRNLKRQKCRWRQCLRFASEKYIPVNLKSSNHPVILERLQREKLAADETEKDEKMETLQPKLDVKLTPRLPIIKLERLDYKNGGFTATNDGGGWIIGKVETKPIKQECKESNEVVQEIQEEPLDLHCPVKSEEFIVETDDIEAADESTPVITQIFSFGSLNAKNSLDPVLQEMLMELKEIPLPAHWEILSNIGPTLQLVQRSKASTMAETVVHIQPGLYFHIVVREYTVPSFHELYETHPSRLTTVDEVVELICDLEAYRPCAGLPRQGPRSPNCQVLVYGEWCPECSLKPWPSGFVR
ncbi:PREDICTED: methyl-CpG-binding domain protein 1 [Nanorana parkeri]|uniref:methyl-CpG-binding domain protein 1 n=1 Tax=Nanorana parkeri TaxID=125878 RepID=UPI000854545B|nr:PREDICTED: methyl-CpG-binding domain protein 1 [Nanorana parkeri]